MVFWIHAKLDGHCSYLNFDLSSLHITMGTNKGNPMQCPIVCTLHLKREMQPTNKNVMSFSSLNIFNFKHYKLFLMTQPFFVKSWRFEKGHSCYSRPIKESSSSPRFLQWSCLIWISRWFVISWWSFVYSWWPCMISSSPS